MINASDFRNGVTFEMDNGVWTIISFLMLWRETTLADRCSLLRWQPPRLLRR